MSSIACCKGRYTAVTISSNSTKRLIKQSRPTLALFSILCMISLQPSHPLTMMASSTHSSKLQTTGGLFRPHLFITAPMFLLGSFLQTSTIYNPGGKKFFKQSITEEKRFLFLELGKREAKAAAKYLKQFSLQHVAASPLSRALFGAKQITESDDSATTLSDIFVHDGFRELNRGSWALKTAVEIGLDLLERFNACDHTVTPDGGGESYLQLKERVMDGHRQLLEMTDAGKASALVSHLQVTRAILSDALDLPPNKIAQLKVGTASITCIDYCTLGGKPQVHFQSWKPEIGLPESYDGAN
eukprot:CAMPEP_0172417784 /NCGR_PEP_ID=MMETSP1064-20121228/4275_1 /TAXON_ID=202472 /ORGANISM="Aulacoseira subarctica , Strain CCAP 1002/5" /LENGTH=299 /DNA_ID=CAMNT_0013156291 /DNA_START=1 /DNA_END=900 /DNA_ORIENTATION=+